MSPDREFSAGGVVSRGDKLLLVEVTNLKGEKKWTFPKGHPEAGETAQQTALREVEEETGWKCRIKRELLTVGYKFTRQGRLVDKKVQWFWMEPQKKTGRPDEVEVHRAEWFDSDEAFQKLSYDTDLELLAEWKKKAFINKPATGTAKDAKDAKGSRRGEKKEKSRAKRVERP